MTINLPLSEEIFQKIKARAEKSGEFATPEAYILFVLEQLVADTSSGAAYTAEDEAKVKARLEGLGYLE